jgi:hypothetical protein
VEGEGKFLKTAGTGWLEFDVQRGCKWHHEPGKSNQSFVVQRDGVKELFADYLNEKIGKK